MAYISKEQVAGIRTELKTRFPKLKFSVTRKDYLSVMVSITEGNIDFGTDYKQINEYHEKHPVLKEVISVVNKDNYDNSDAMTDYFNVGYYTHISIGKWDKPYLLKS